MQNSNNKNEVHKLETIHPTNEAGDKNFTEYDKMNPPIASEQNN